MIVSVQPLQVRFTVPTQPCQEVHDRGRDAVLRQERPADVGHEEEKPAGDEAPDDDGQGLRRLVLSLGHPSGPSFRVAESTDRRLPVLREFRHYAAQKTPTFFKSMYSNQCVIQIKV